MELNTAVPGGIVEVVGLEELKSEGVGPLVDWPHPRDISQNCLQDLVDCGFTRYPLTLLLTSVRASGNWTASKFESLFNEKALDKLEERGLIVRAERSFRLSPKFIHDMCELSRQGRFTT